MTHYNRIAGRNVRRIEALSDGVFAIAITLLVLEIRPPHAEAHTEWEVLSSLHPLLPKFLTYFLSFMTMGIFWVGQGVQLNLIEQYDRNLSWTTIFFLVVISLFPFTTAFLGEYITFKVAIGIYWLNILLAGILIYFHWHYAAKHNFLTIEGEERRIIDKAVRKRVIVAQSLYLVGALLCFINTYLSIGFIILVQLNYAFAIISEKISPKK
jgi:TMEM175 potassium channel family protein